MPVNDMQSRLKFLEMELERTVQMLEREIAAEAPNVEQRLALKAAAGKIMIELGGLQMRLTGNESPTSRSISVRSPAST